MFLPVRVSHKVLFSLTSKCVHMSISSSLALTFSQETWSMEATAAETSLTNCFLGANQLSKRCREAHTSRNKQREAHVQEKRVGWGVGAKF